MPTGASETPIVCPMVDVAWFLLACDTCLGHRSSRMPYLVLGGFFAVAAIWWCLVQALLARSARRWAVAGATGFAIALLAIASVTVVPVGPADSSCSSAITATSMRHDGPRSSWDESGCDAAGWRRIHQAQAIGSIGIVIGVASAIATRRRAAPDPDGARSNASERARTG